MKIKKFVFPPFEEWLKREDDTEIVVGAYKCQVGVFYRISGSCRKRYMFAVSYANTNPHNIYTEKLFCKIFDYTGDKEELKKWYYETIEEFNTFWESLIKSTYFDEE